MWLVGLIALGAVVLLQQRVDTTRRGQLVLADVGAQIGVAPSIAFSTSLGSQASSAQVQRRLAAARARFDAAVGDLARLDSAEHAVELTRLGDAFFETLEQVRASVHNGKPARAAQIMGTAQRAGGTEFELRQAVERARRTEGIEAGRGGLLAGLGSVLVIVLTLLACSYAFLGAVRARRRAERLAADNQSLLDLTRRDEYRYRDLFENANEPIATVDLDWNLTEVNGAFERALGYSREELVGSSLALYLTAEGWRLSEHHRARKLSGEERGATYEQEFVAKSGELVPFEVSTRLIEEDGWPVGVQGVCRDIRTRRRAEADLVRLSELNRHQAVHDALTGLPNRRHLLEEIERAIGERAAAKTTFGLLLIDLDRFKEVNDALGHHSGDILLCELAERLRSSLRKGDSVARLGGDEFGVLLRDMDENHPHWLETVDRLGDSLELPVYVQGLPVSVEASIGVAIYPTHAADAETLLQRADIAMYVAKKHGRGHAVYSADEDTSDAGRLALLGELRQALDGDELVVYYQPEVNTHTGEVVRVEALARWQHPEHGLIPPSAFVPMAEQTGLIRPLTRYVIREAVRQVRAWDRLGHHVDVAVNLSTRNLAEPDLVENIVRILGDAGLEPARLMLEITESAIVADPLRTEHTLRRLSALGVKLAIDDFGIGYTSLSHLARLPIDQIKIDRSFSAGIQSKGHEHAIVRSIVGLGHDLGMEVIVEGVDRPAVADELRRIGCDLMQGFLVARPLTPSQLVRWLAGREDESHAEPQHPGRRFRLVG